MDKITLLMFIGESAFLLFIFFYVLKLEKFIEQKFASIEISVEEINNELFLLKKEIKNNNTSKSLEKIEKIVENIVDDVRFIEERNKEFYKEIEEKIAKLKLNVKNSSVNSLGGVSENERVKILNLHKQGYSIEEIAKEVRIPAGEVELILKFPNLY